MEDEFDALLYLGAPADISHATLPPELCADSAYRKMRTERLTLAAFGGDPLRQTIAPGLLGGRRRALRSARANLAMELTAQI